MPSATQLGSLVVSHAVNVIAIEQRVMLCRWDLVSVVCLAFIYLRHTRLAMADRVQISSSWFLLPTDAQHEQTVGSVLILV